MFAWLYKLIPIRPTSAWRPPLALILLAVNVMVLALPVAGFFLLRIYESSLVRQTETGLKTQGVLIGATYQATAHRLKTDQADYDSLLKPDERLTKSVLPPIQPKLDLATAELLPPPPLPTPLAFDPPLLAYTAGVVLAPILDKSKAVTGAEIHLLDSTGQVVASTKYKIDVSLRQRPEVLTSLRGRVGAVLRSKTEESQSAWMSFFSRSAGLEVNVAVPILVEDGLLGAVVLSRPPDTLLTAFAGKSSEFMTAGLFLLAVILLLSIFTSLTISTPIRQLIAQSRRAMTGETGAMQPLDHPVTAELAELSDAVALMASSLEQRTDYIRSFAAQLSHELKSPLTSMRGAIELLQEYPDMTNERRGQFLDNINGDVDRLTRLVTLILELARAEADKGAKVNEASLSDTFTFLLQYYPEIELDDPSELLDTRLRVPLSEDDLYAILKNLTENAYQHGASVLAIYLGQNFQAKQQSVWLRFLDNGPGVSEGNRDKIFDPFFTTDRGQGGTGLGLPLVASLLEGIGGSITYVEGYEGACFDIVMPLLPTEGQKLRV